MTCTTLAKDATTVLAQLTPIDQGVSGRAGDQTRSKLAR